MFEIVSDSDFLYDSKGQLFTCNFYCLTENGAFPDEEWTDFGQTVLSWWSEEVLRISNAQIANFQLLFEDGPFWIDGTKQGDIVTLHFCTDKKCFTAPPDVQMHFHDLVRSIKRAIRHLSSELFLAGNVTASQQLQIEMLKLKQFLE